MCVGGGSTFTFKPDFYPKKVIFIQFANEIEYIHPERVVVGSTLFKEAFKYYFADFFSEKGWVLFKSPKLISEKIFSTRVWGYP